MCFIMSKQVSSFRLPYLLLLEKSTLLCVLYLKKKKRRQIEIGKYSGLLLVSCIFWLFTHNY